MAVIEVSVALSANVESGKCGFMTATFRPVDDLVECLVFSQGLEGHRGFELVIDVSEAAARCLVDAGFAACLFLDSSRLNLVLLFQLRN